MKYYKIIIGSKIIGIGTTIDLRCFQLKNNVLLRCTEQDAQFIAYEENLYHALWMDKVVGNCKYRIANVLEVSESEYDSLSSLFKVQESIEIIEPEPEPVIEPKSTPIEFEDIKNYKIEEMNLECKKYIYNGVDVLIDNKNEHFSYKLEDQNNLSVAYDIASKLNTGTYYHSDGNQFKHYTRNQIISIYIAQQLNVYKNTLYCKELAEYIKGLKSEEDVAQVYYGMELPSSNKENYQKKYNEIEKSLLTLQLNKGGA